MKLKSLEELKCLLPEEEQEELRRPKHLRTKVRVLPLLPHWMKKKLLVAKELFNNNNTEYEDALFWNHQLVLPLDAKHEVTFAILDNKNGTYDQFKEVIAKVVEVYKQLQVICRKYGYPLTLVSEQSDDFGMYLPYSFFKEEEEESISGSTSIENFITQLCIPRYTKMHEMEKKAKQFADSMEDEGERRKFNLSFAYFQKELLDYHEAIKNTLSSSQFDYWEETLASEEDLYIGKEREWGRELCIKFETGESLKHVAQLDKIYPLLVQLKEYTRNEDFAFGVKPKDKKVERGNAVNAQ